MKPKFLRMWTVVRNNETEETIIWYGSYEQFIDDFQDENDVTIDINSNPWEEIPFEDWSSEEITAIFTNDIEDGNWHSWTWLPSELLRSLKYWNIDEEDCRNILLDTYQNWYRLT